MNDQPDWLPAPTSLPQVFVEIYNVTADPFQLRNIKATFDEDVQAKLSQRLMKLESCAGPSCRTPGLFHHSHRSVPHGHVQLAGAGGGEVC